MLTFIKNAGTLGTVTSLVTPEPSEGKPSRTVLRGRGRVNRLRLSGAKKELDMTADKFRSLALEPPGALESAHMGHADFRVEGKIFASLGYPDESSGMVKLTPEQQRSFLRKAPGVFDPCAGAWGRGGATSVHLAAARVDMLRAALEAASKNVASHAKNKNA